MLKKLSLLLVLGLFFACGDDDSTTPPAEQPPEVVEPPMTFSGPATTDPVAAPVQSYVSVANSMSQANAAMLTSIIAATGSNASYSNGVWTWTYVEGQHTYTVTCELRSDGWHWICTVDGGIFENCTIATGFTSGSDNSGWWKFHDCDTGAVTASASWLGDETSGSVDWYEGDFQAGGTLVLQSTWSTTGSSTTTTLTAPQQIKIVVTENTDGSGELFVYEWDDMGAAWTLVFEAHWNANGSGSYTNHLTGETRTWG
ncbi:hypothetical protein JXA88_19135 [Candidatus Fermentibacteria bacterium]|nr:hypothetical protein [Candidatus Fermentibacteria bacterium]